MRRIGVVVGTGAVLAAWWSRRRVGQLGLDARGAGEGLARVRRRSPRRSSATTLAVSIAAPPDGAGVAVAGADRPGPRRHVQLRAAREPVRPRHPQRRRGPPRVAGASSRATGSSWSPRGGWGCRTATPSRSRRSRRPTTSCCARPHRAPVERGLDLRPRARGRRHPAGVAQPGRAAGRRRRSARRPRRAGDGAGRGADDPPDAPRHQGAGGAGGARRDGPDLRRRPGPRRRGPDVWRLGHLGHLGHVDVAQVDEHEPPRRQAVLAPAPGLDQALVGAAAHAVGDPVGEGLVVGRGPPAVALEEGVGVGHRGGGVEAARLGRRAPAPALTGCRPASARSGGGRAWWAGRRRARAR